MKNIDGMSLKVYILENYDKYFEMSSSRYKELNQLLDEYNASRYTKQQFCKQFGLSDIGFFQLLRILVNYKNYKALVDIGQKFAPKQVVTRGRKRSH